jgi:hypothetical protein
LKILAAAKVKCGFRACFFDITVIDDSREVRVQKSTNAQFVDVV